MRTVVTKRSLAATLAAAALLLIQISGSASQGIIVKTIDEGYFHCLGGELQEGEDCSAYQTTIKKTDRREYLACYRQCVSVCQRETETVGDERLCVDSECLRGGEFGC
ncbi:MAG: hypothetical protein INR68_04240 [Methylobacterium mesophilicum]|nr:hypothetical protein [Methylobacterium mesophilicum]